MNSRALLASLMLICLLSACDETRFASNPLGEARACEPSLAGVWRVENENEAEPDPEYFELEPDCDLRVLHAVAASEGGLSAGTHDRTSPRLFPSIAPIGGVLYLSITDQEFHQAAQGSGADPVHPDRSAGFHLFRIERNGEFATIFPLDHQAIAREIANGTLAGETRTADKNLNNLLLLDADAARGLLQQNWVFRRDSAFRVRRIAPDDLPTGIRRQIRGRS